MACLTCPITRGSSPVYQGRKGRSPHTTDPVLKQEDSFPIPSRTPSRHVSRTKLVKPLSSPPSSNTPYDSSDDDIHPIVPPALLRHLHDCVKSARERPKPYQRSSPNIVERLYGEEYSGCTGSQEPLERSLCTLRNLTPEALARAVIAIRADVEWRRARAIASALHVDAVQKRSMFLDLTAKNEAQAYVDAKSKPLETATEALASCTADELNDRRNRGIAAYSLDAASFATADTEFDHVENFALTLLDSESDGDTSADDETFGDN